MLYKPKNMIPSTNTPYKVINHLVDNYFSCIVTGTNAISAYRLTIRDVDASSNWSWTPGKVVLSEPFYPINYDGSIRVFDKIHLPPNKFSHRHEPYKWTVEFWEAGNNTENPDVISSEEVFFAYQKAEIAIVIPSIVQTQEQLITVAYAEHINFPIQWFGWKLTNITTGEVLINSYDSNHIYGTKNNIAVKCEGLLSGQKYKIECRALDANDCEIVATPKEFTVEYNTTAVSVEFSATSLPDEQGVLINMGDISVIKGSLNCAEEYRSNYPVENQTSLNIPKGKTLTFSDDVSNGFTVPDDKTIVWSGSFDIEHGIPDFSGKSLIENGRIQVIRLEDETGMLVKALDLWYSYDVNTGIYNGAELIYTTYNLTESKDPKTSASMNITSSPPYRTAWYVVKLLPDGTMDVKIYERTGVTYPSNNLYPSDGLDGLFPSSGTGWKLKE